MYNLCVFVCLTKITFFSPHRRSYSTWGEHEHPEENISSAFSETNAMSLSLELEPEPADITIVRAWRHYERNPTNVSRKWGWQGLCVCKYAYSHCWNTQTKKYTNIYKYQYKNWYKYTRVVCVRKVALPVIVINCRPLHCAAYTQGEHPFKSQTRMKIQIQI